MAAFTGKSNAKWIRVWVEASDAGLEDISSDVTNVTIPIVFDNADVTGFSDGVRNVQIGHPSMDLTMDGVFNNTVDTGAHVVLSSIVGDTGANSPYTVKIQIGIRKAPEATDPEFLGTDAYYCTAYTVNGDLTWNATFSPGTGTAPAWGAYS